MAYARDDDVLRDGPADVVDAQGGFRATFGQPKLSGAALRAELERPEPPFVLKTIAELLPDDARGAYERECGAKACG